MLGIKEAWGKEKQLTWATQIASQCQDWYECTLYASGAFYLQKVYVSSPLCISRYFYSPRNNNSGSSFLYLYIVPLLLFLLYMYE